MDREQLKKIGYLLANDKSILVEPQVILHTKNFNKWLSKYFMLSEGLHYKRKNGGKKIETLDQLHKMFEKAYHEPSVSK